MYLTDYTFLREDLEFNSRFPSDLFLQKRQKDARRKLMRWIGKTEYDAAVQVLSQPDPDETSDEFIKADAFRSAESKLVWYYAIPILGKSLSEQGIILSSESKAQPGANVSAATPKQLEAMRNLVWKDAWDIVSQYVTLAGVLPVRPAWGAS
jgi:hypothetical protein